MTNPFNQHEDLSQAEEKLRKSEEKIRQQELIVLAAKEKVINCKKAISDIDAEIARQTRLRDEALSREKIALRKAMMWRFGPIVIVSLLFFMLLLLR